MQQHRDNIHDSAPLRRLMDQQVHALMPGLQRCFGTHALLLGVGSNAVPPALPMIGNWTVLRVVNGRHTGDVRAAADEPLPFVDEAFDLVVLRHALETVPHAPALLDEAVRVLAPGGTLALTGLHPLSGWALWFYWRERGPHRLLQMPSQLVRALRRAGLEVDRVQRVGNLWPGLAAARRAPISMFGGGYVLVARKRKRMITPLRIRSKPMRVPVNSRLSPGIRRGAVS